MANSSRVLTMYDAPMWQSIANYTWALQRCNGCHQFRYPPSPICADCHDMDYEWVPVKGTGTLMSWTVFHRQYFDDFPPPYNVITVRLDEGPIVVTNLVGAEPDKTSIGRAITIIYEEHNGQILPRARFAT